MNSEMNMSMQSRRLGGEPGANGTPESEFSNFECYQNYTAPEVFVQGLAGIVNQGDVEVIVRAQKQMLQRFEKSNEMLLNCNALSSSRLKLATDDFKVYIKLINDMKKDLDYVFKKIRSIKGKVNAQYPLAAKQLEKKTKTNSLCEELAEDEATEAKDEQKGSIESQPSAADAKKPKTIHKHTSTVNYVKMEHSPESGKSNATDAVQRKSFDESTDNESSDCTTDT